MVWEPEAEKGPRPRLKLAVTTTALTRARGVLGQDDEASVRPLLQQNLSAEDLALVPDRRSPSGWTQESKVSLDLIGSELLHTARFDREATGTLVLTGVRALPPATLERRRDAGLSLGHDVVFSGDWPSQREDADLLDSLQLALAWFAKTDRRGDRGPATFRTVLASFAASDPTIGSGISGASPSDQPIDRGAATTAPRRAGPGGRWTAPR